MDSIAQALLGAQDEAARLFAAVVAANVIQPGLLESEVSVKIHALAKSQFGLRRHWHKRIVRAGPNTLLTYGDDCADRRIGADDLVYLDFGPVFEEWEADFGRTSVLGADPVKHRLVADLSSAHRAPRGVFRSATAIRRHCATPIRTGGRAIGFSRFT